MRAKSESSESDGSQQSTPRNKKSGKHASKRHHRGDHKSSRREKREESADIKKEATEVAEWPQLHEQHFALKFGDVHHI